MVYPASGNETERIEQVKNLLKSGLGRDAGMNALVGLTSETYRVPISAISLLDHDRQWFKASVGVPMSDASREHTFCNLTIAGDGPVVIEDASKDERLRHNPLVVGQPHIQFYAGVPLALSPGVNVGSLCIIDQKPRRMDQAELTRLQQLGQVAVSLLRQDGAMSKVLELSEKLHREGEVISAQAALIARQSALFDRASALGRLGDWQIDLATGVMTSSGLHDLFEIDRSSTLQFDIIMDFFPELDRSRLAALIDKSRQDNLPYKFEGRIVTAKGRSRWVRVIGDAELLDGKPVRRFGLWQDLTEEKSLVDQLEMIALYDDLTRLPNRKALRDAIVKDAEDASKRIGLISLDIDNFNDVNDAAGSAAGDACLIALGRRFQIAAGAGNLVARVDGDEFMVLVREQEGGFSVEDVARLLLASMAVPVQCNEQSFQFSVSIGVAAARRSVHTSADDLICESDLALQEAKATGRNRCTIFRPSLLNVSRQRYETIGAVRHALSMKQLELYYQPKVRLADRSHCGFEALLRWNKSAQDVVAPGAFMAALEDPTLSKAIGDFVMMSAIEQAATWMREGVPFGHIAINLSASQFRSPDIAAELFEAIAAHGLKPGMIEVEVTENILLAVSDGVLKSCQDFKAGGVRIAFDDFGTGYASLSHLRDFPVDRIKIDRSFISELERGDNTSIVNAMVGLAHSLSMSVVAEGVETDYQASFLAAIGCDEAQGYLFSRPVPAEAAARHLCKEMVMSLVQPTNVIAS